MCGWQDRNIAQGCWYSTHYSVSKELRENSTVQPVHGIACELSARYKTGGSRFIGHEMLWHLAFDWSSLELLLVAVLWVQVLTSNLTFQSDHVWERVTVFGIFLNPRFVVLLFQIPVIFVHPQR